MRSIPCEVHFGYQLSICSEIEKNHGQPSWTRPVYLPRSERPQILSNLLRTLANVHGIQGFLSDVEMNLHFSQTQWITARTTRNTNSDYFILQHLLICFCEEDAVRLLQRKGLVLGVNIYQPLDKFICGTYDNVSRAEFCGVPKIKYIYLSDKKKKHGDENKISLFSRSELPPLKTKYYFHLQNARSSCRPTVKKALYCLQHACKRANVPDPQRLNGHFLPAWNWIQCEQTSKGLLTHKTVGG